MLSSNLEKSPKFMALLGRCPFQRCSFSFDRRLLMWSLLCRFPGQEHVAGNSKIPSVIYYDQYGSIKAAGAEADTAAMASLAEEQAWIRTEL
jgi:hypothetical protein